MGWHRQLARSLHVDVGLLVLFACSEIVYLVAFLVRFPLLPSYQAYRPLQYFIPGDLALAETVLAFAALFVLYALAWRRARRLPSDAGTKVILGCGAVFCTTMAFVFPITAPDIFKYVAAGRILFHYHENPIFIAPSAFPHDPIMSLADGIRYSAAPYGPLGILVDSFPTLLTDGSLLANLLCLKLFFSACLLADAYLAYRIASRLWPGQGAVAALLVAWNPLAVFQTGAGGHNDPAMLLLALLGFFAVVEGKLTEGPVFVATSSLVKYGTLPLLPLVVAYGAARHSPVVRRVGYVAAVLATILTVAILSFAPFWHGLDTFQRALREEEAHEYSFSGSVVALIASPGSTGTVTLLGRVAFALAFAWALRLCVRDATQLMRASTFSLLVFLAFAASTVRPWYALWPLVFAAAGSQTLDRVAAVLLTFGVAVGGLLFSDGYVLGPLGRLGRPEVFPYLLTFVPPATVWLASLAPGRRPGAPPFAGRLDDLGNQVLGRTRVALHRIGRVRLPGRR